MSNLTGNRRKVTALGRMGPGSLSEISSRDKRPASLQETASPASQAVVRARVEHGMCPFCDRGPFTVLAIHTHKVHAVDRLSLREMAGLVYSSSITAPEFHERRSADSRRLYDEGITLRVRPKNLSPRNLSPKAKQILREKMERMTTPDMRRRGGENKSRHHLTATLERDASIVRELGDGLTYTQVGERHGVHPKTVAVVARRHGVEEDGRSRYWRSRRGQFSESLRAGAETRQRNIDAIWARREQAFGGGESIESIAARESIQPKALRAGFRERGIAVPDGRGTCHLADPWP